MKLSYPQGSVLTSMVLELKTITGNLHQSYHSYSFKIQKSCGKVNKTRATFPLLKKVAGKLIKDRVTFPLLKKVAGVSIKNYATFPLLKKGAGKLIKKFATFPLLNSHCSKTYMVCILKDT